MYGSNEATQSVHKDTLHQPQNTNSQRDMRDNTAHMIIVGESDDKLHDIEIGTSPNGNPRQDQVTIGEGSESWTY